jgi:hypothetical protein
MLLCLKVVAAEWVIKMPGKACDKIKDKAKRKRCKNYTGEFAGMKPMNTANIKRKGKSGY